MNNNNALVNVFSGADVSVIFGESYIGECMSLTVGVNREAGPLYTMGRKEPIAIPKGKRGVGGSFILAQLGYEALLKYYSEVMGNNPPLIWVRKDEAIPETGMVRKVDSANADAASFDSNGLLTGVDDGLWDQLSTPNYADQMPPFNMTIIGLNEQGSKMGFRIYGVAIINEGVAISIDELNVEKRYTFIAQAVSRMVRLDDPNQN